MPEARRGMVTQLPFWNRILDGKRGACMLQEVAARLSGARPVEGRRKSAE